MQKTGIRFNRNQLDFLKKQTQKTGKASAIAIKKTGLVMLNLVKESVSISAFSRAELASRDHPYAKRHGKISVSGRPPYAVGKKTGSFARSIFGKTTNQYEFRISYRDTEIGRYIVMGTRVMLPRDPIIKTFQTKKNQKIFKKTLDTEFKKAMK